LSEIEKLKEQGLIKGGNLDNAVVIIDKEIDPKEINRLRLLFGIKDEIIMGANGILNGKKLRFKNEPVRHKALDLIGDLALLGIPIKGHVIAARSGHAANVELVKKIKREYEKKILQKKYQKKTSSDYILDINGLLKLLPHRYPFVLIDRIMEMTPGEKLTAIKNVTYNEPFFQGHFPGQPVMPGVLILEGMAQTGDRSRLTLKASDEIFVVGQVAMHHFDGHVSVQAGLVCLVDFGHPPSAQLGDDAILSNGLTDEICHRLSPGLNLAIRAGKWSSYGPSLVTLTES